MRTAEFYAFMRERESIRQKKLAGLPKPWTKDPILQNYKFTNVKREHDATSAALITEFYRPHYDDDKELILLNAAIARYFGTVEFMRAVGWQKGFYPQRLIDCARNRLEAKQRVFTGAYIITNNGIAGPKEQVVTNVFLTDLWNQSKAIIAAQKKSDNRWQAVVEALQVCRGFGGSGFMAKETILDTRYTGFWPPNTPVDKNTWTPVGPGSLRGAARVLGKTNPDPDKAPKVSIAEALQVCKDLFAERKQADITGLYWPPQYPELELTDIQFQLCEFDKMERTRLGQGTPRSRYPGGAL